MFVIVLNASNIIHDGFNNKLVYKFPNSITFKNKYISVSNISMYYSWFNILQSLNNNLFTYTWTVGAISTVYNILIPDGLYEIADINKYIQFVCVNNGHYLINAGLNIYFFELLVNPNRYAVQLNTYQVPIALPAGYSQPSNFAGYPTQTFNPIINFPFNFNDIVGYGSIGGVYFSSDDNINNVYVAPTASKSNYYVTKDLLGTISYLSNVYPNVQPNSSIFFSISNINNPYSSPSSIIYSLSPSVEIGHLIIDKPTNFIWNKMIDGTYNDLRLSLLGTDLSPLYIADEAMTILLTIKDLEENI